MKTVKMTFKNSDGKTIEKDIEERLVSTYKSMGWELKKEEIKSAQERPTFSRRNVEE